MYLTKWRVGHWQLILVCAAALLARPGFAQEGEEAAESNVQSYLENPEAPAAEESREYINLEVKDKDLGELLKFISSQVGVNIIADPEVTEKVTIVLDSVYWRNALEVIAKHTNCQIVEVSPRLIRFSQPPSISMEFQDADIKVVLELLAKQAGANIVMASDIQGKVSLSLREVPWREALETIVKTAGYVIVPANTGPKEILRVVRPESLKEQLVTRHFQLRYIRPSDPYTAIITGTEQWANSQFAGSGTSAAFNPQQANAGSARDFNLALALRETISENGSLQYDDNTNTFIVKDTEKKLEEIANIINLVDVKQPQIYVEVRFISTTNTDILERGIRWDLPSTPERDGFIISARGAEPDPTAVDPLFQFGGTFPFDIGEMQDVPNQFEALGILDFTDARMILKLIKDDENSRIVQEPSLTMIDNRPATIFVGETVPFAVQEVQIDQNGNATVSIDENKRSPINVGFTLYLIPHVIPGTDEISMTVIPKVSTLVGTTSEIDGFERFEFSQGASDASTFIDLPREASQTVVTTLRVRNGHTAVLGGLQTERREEIVSKIPGLSSIPIFGNIFTYKRKRNQVESLIILITPHILSNTDEEEQRFGEARRKASQKDYFFRRYEDDSNLPKKSESAAKGN